MISSLVDKRLHTTIIRLIWEEYADSLPGYSSLDSLLSHSPYASLNEETLEFYSATKFILLKQEHDHIFIIMEMYLLTTDQNKFVISLM